MQGKLFRIELIKNPSLSALWKGPSMHLRILLRSTGRLLHQKVLITPNCCQRHYLFIQNQVSNRAMLYEVGLALYITLFVSLDPSSNLETSCRSDFCRLVDVPHIISFMKVNPSTTIHRCTPCCVPIAICTSFRISSDISSRSSLN